MDDSYAYNKKLMLILTVATTAVLAVAAALMVLLTAHSASDKGLAAYVVVVPIIFNALAFGFSWKDMEPDMKEDDIAYFRQRGLTFGLVIFAITLLVIVILAIARRSVPRDLRGPDSRWGSPRPHRPGRGRSPSM